jgi:hypothetical protein
VTARWRLGVHDDQGDGMTRWHELEDGGAEDAYQVWRLLRDYGRDGIGVTVQRRVGDGDWQIIDPPLVTRPFDWPHDQ